MNPDSVRELAERMLRRDDVMDALGELSGRWRGETIRLSERASATFAGVFRELGLVTRDEWDELELRVAQLEHRLRLLERDAPLPASHE